MANHDIDLMSVHYTLVNLEVPTNMKIITACALDLNFPQYVAAELRRLSSKNPRAAKSTSTAMLSTRMSVRRQVQRDGQLTLYQHAYDFSTHRIWCRHQLSE